MASTVLNEAPNPGFSFENCKRNAFLFDKGLPPPKMTKTGTTICGVVFKNGVVLGADTRATGGNLVSDKNCRKIHQMAPNMMCCGAGTAADCDKTTTQMESQLELHRLNTGRQVPVTAAVRMLKQKLFRYQGHIGAYLVMGGVDADGPQLVSIAAHGSSQKGPFLAMGSGMLAAMTVLEMRWKPDMEEKDAIQLVRDAIASGIFNDMGSGSNVDIAVIRPKDDIEYFRGYDVANKKGERRQKYEFKKGTVPVLKEVVRKTIIIEEETVRSMDVDDEFLKSWAFPIFL